MNNHRKIGHHTFTVRAHSSSLERPDIKSYYSRRVARVLRERDVLSLLFLYPLGQLSALLDKAFHLQSQSSTQETYHDFLSGCSSARCTCSHLLTRSGASVAQG
ncbi:hypothetical protein QCA50_014468 [Cerrena zonata]|uniref:Uncharacterized protein n=1 Tax=Cerrena zonata TaxID=2478898 RepID=A0AAW0FTT4_9APHY